MIRPGRRHGRNGISKIRCAGWIASAVSLCFDLSTGEKQGARPPRPDLAFPPDMGSLVTGFLAMASLRQFRTPFVALTRVSRSQG